MASGIGVDIIAVQRVRDAVETTGQRFLDRVFTAEEQHRASRHEDRIAYYATRFAAKEAVFKTLGTDWTDLTYRDIEIIDGPHGEPLVVPHGGLVDRLGARAESVSVSVACDEGLAVAVATLWSKRAREMIRMRPAFVAILVAAAIVGGVYGAFATRVWPPAGMPRVRRGCDVPPPRSCRATGAR